MRNATNTMSKLTRVVLGCGIACVTGLAPATHAGQVTVTVGASSMPGPSNCAVAVDAMIVPVPLPPLASAGVVRNQMLSALSMASILAEPIGLNSMIVTCETSFAILPPNPISHVRIGDGRVTHGMFGFAGHFQPNNAQLQPAIFTGGIVTDVGELTVQISAQELNFQTDGPIICQALFQRLAPRAPQFGALINYAGDRLEIYFDPAYTVTQGGIIFGTTSPTPGSSGRVELEPTTPRCVADVDDGSGSGTPDGGVTIEDLIFFLRMFDLGHIRADVDDGSGTGTPDGGVSIEDLLYYLTRFDAGC